MMGKTIEVYGFPSHVTVSLVKRFIEQYTGEETVFAIKIRQGKGRVPRAFAIIQFTSAKHATHMLSLADKSLWYSNSYLKVREVERDIVPRPRTFLDSLNNVKLYFGCQISKGRISVLWKKVNDVSVDFGIGMRKWRFFLFHGDNKYKLELSYENIWKIELYQPQGEATKYLLIQVVKSNFLFSVFLKAYASYFLSIHITTGVVKQTQKVLLPTAVAETTN